MLDSIYCHLLYLLSMNTQTKKNQLLSALQETESGFLSIDELITSVSELLVQVAPVQTKYKVSEVPDGRTIRYYISQGLMSKPLGYAGGRANYDNAHILTLLVIKKLQAEHFSLRQIKQTLESLRNKYKPLADFQTQLVNLLFDQANQETARKKQKINPDRLLARSSTSSNTSSGTSSSTTATDKISYHQKTRTEKTIRYNINTLCTLYVSESALEHDISEVVTALRKLADQLETQ